MIKLIPGTLVLFYGKSYMYRRSIIDEDVSVCLHELVSFDDVGMHVLQLNANYIDDHAKNLKYYSDVFNDIT